MVHAQLRKQQLRIAESEDDTRQVRSNFRLQLKRLKMKHSNELGKGQ